MKKQFMNYLLLIGYGLVMVALVWKSGSLFISTTDYSAQHFAFADYFRKLFFETKDLFPDFASAIGGGQNIYNFSYYGLLRPDVLISFLLPSVPISCILIFYAIFLYLLGGCLLFHWIKNHNFNTGICLLMGFLFLSSSVLFQTHRQIMFVNYMPFLIISLLGVDKYLKDKKAGLLVGGIFLMIMHSYYFSVSGIILCVAYYLYRFYNIYKISGYRFHHYLYGKDAFYKIFLWQFTAVMLSAIFLLPTALSMLENMRVGNSTAVSGLFDFNFLMNTVMYDYYGCGFSYFVWFILCVGLTMKKTRAMSAGCMISLLLPVVPYILNGTLYVHRKVYLAFIPVILYLCAKILNLKLEKCKSDEKHYIVIALVPFLPVLAGRVTIWLLADAIATVIILYLAKRKKNVIWLTVLISSIVCLQLNNQEEYLTKESFATYYNDDNFKNIDNNDNYRFISLTGGFYKSNYVANPLLLQTSVYSSIQNQNYQSFMMDTMHLSTTSRNNMVHTNSSNIFFQMFMGSRILHTKNIVPAGYELNTTNQDQSMLFKNNDVLPIAYATDNLMRYDEFQSLQYPYTLDTLINTSIVENPKNASNYESRISKKSLAQTVVFPDSSNDVKFHRDTDSLLINSEKTCKFNVTLNNNDNIVIIRTKIKPNDAVHNDIYVSVNNIKEKLSGTNAPYNNQNMEFEYVVSANEAITTLAFECSPGNYYLNDIEIYTCNYDDIHQYHHEITPLNTKKCSGKDILKGDLEMKNDGYFITSIPYQNGLKALVDGNPVAIEKVNCGFAGFALSPGKHDIVISFRAPGKKAGTIVSLFGMVICILSFILSKKKSHMAK